MSDPLNLREIERVCRAPECQACNMIREANGTWTHNKNCIEATVLALVALVREGRTHIKARRARCLNKSHQQTWPTCQLCEAEDAWLARVRDKED